MTATRTGLVITEPGVYDGIPDADYHADPVPGGSLSSTGARVLLPPSCPAIYRYRLDHPPEPKAHFDLGTAAHRLILGAGRPIACVEAPDWRTTAAKETRDAIRADGATPLLRKDYDQVQAMAAALRAHPVAAALLDPDAGYAEQTLVWQDPDFGIWCRARLDWLPRAGYRPRLIITDYKSAESASPRAFARAAANYGYHQQAAFYLAGARQLGLCENPVFVFVAQEKTAPYLVSLIELNDTALEVGAALNRRAAEIFRDCAQAGLWPGYPDDVALVGLPAWATYLPEEPE